MNITKCLRKAFVNGTPPVAASENGCRISKGGLTQNDLFGSTNLNVLTVKSWQLSASKFV